MHKHQDRKSILQITFFTLLLLTIILFLTYTSEDVRWGGGFWETWLGRHVQLGSAAAHQIVFWFRKTMHFLGYGALGILFWYYFYLWRINLCMWLGIGATAAVAVYDEYAQSLTGFRSGKPEDVALDICGALAICLAARWMRTKLRSKVN